MAISAMTATTATMTPAIFLPFFFGAVLSERNDCDCWPFCTPMLAPTAGMTAVPSPMLFIGGTTPAMTWVCALVKPSENMTGRPAR